MGQQKNKGERGVIVIEATISLTAFMFALVMIMSLINICIVQARVSNAINITAKELSQYSYLYSLTGFRESEAKLKENATKDTEDINKVLSNINTVYNEIENLGETGKQSLDNIDNITESWDSAVGSIDKIKEAGGSIETSVKNIAKDPKSVMFGIAKLVASESLELAKSKLIAAPLAKILCEKHLTNGENESAEAYLKHLGVVPGATGSYMDGLDFSESTLFPYGSNEITINVSYDVKPITLLPIDIKFHFNQTAITHGWLAGDATYKKSAELVENSTVWTKSTVNERVSLIRKMGIEDMKKEGYEQVSGMTNVHLYSSEKNEFVTISSMNPLYTSEGEAPMTVEQLNDDEMKKAIETLCGKMVSVTDGETKVNTKIQKDGTTTKKENNCTNAKNKIVLVVPEDEGLKAYMEGIIAEANTKGVTVEVVASYGKGASKTEVKTEGEME